MSRNLPGTLRAEGLQKTYRAGPATVRALDGASFELPAEGFVSIVGPSGCGKSTLLHLLAGLEPADAGTIAIEGDDTPVSLRTALMPQDDLLLPWRSILDNVILAPISQGCDLKAARTKAKALFPTFGLHGFEEAWPRDLSGGMRQRAALMRTFLCERPIHLLDEPFGRLDALTRASMQQWLTAYWEQRRSAVVLVTHSIEEAIFLADQVYLMGPRPGRMLARFDVPFKRPRNYLEVVTSTGFGALKRQLLEQLEAETAHKA